MSGMSRRSLLTATAAGITGAALGGLGLSGCSGVGGSVASGGGKTALRYGFWGNSTRQQHYTKALKQFSQSHSDISVQTEFAEYDAFQERMTTQMAAKSVPDVFWIASPQVLTYAKNGLYHDLSGIDQLKLSDYSEQELDSFKLDGKLNSIPFGIYVPVMRYNASFAEQDGVSIPEDGDKGYSWDGFAEFLADYSKNNKHRRKGLPYVPDADLPFEAWLRQHGEELWNADGQPGFTADGLAAWFDWWQKLRKADAVLTRSEQEGMGPDWEIFGQKVLATLDNSNHIVGEAPVFADSTFKLRHLPADADATEGYHFFYYPRMAMYAGVDKEKVGAAATLIDYNVNQTTMLKTVGLDLGAPPNARVAKEAKAFANKDEQEMLRVVEEDRQRKRNPRFESPAGANNWRTIMTRVAEAIDLRNTTTTKGARQMISEIKTSIERASNQ